jgi:UDP-N-acetylmuramoylalanine--D-glutamate ligase
VACFAMPKLPKNATYIFETSSYQLDLIAKTRFHIASLLNITPDHLDRHHDMEGYIAAKKRIFMNQKEGDYAVIGVDNPNSKRVYEDLKNDRQFAAKIVPISTKIILKDGVSVIDKVIYNNIETPSKIDLGFLPCLQGEHNAQNIAVAFANCVLSKISEEKIVSAIKSFKGLRHRMQLIAKVGDLVFINDSKATNAESTENALKAFENIYWILGGKPKEGGIETLKPYFSKIKYAFLIGEATEEFAKTLDGKVSYFKCGDLKNAFETAYNKAASDSNKGEKNILLSPACASFDQWKNFEQRGDYFCELVNQLKK